jgi:hypothetical protein
MVGMTSNDEEYFCFDVSLSLNVASIIHQGCPLGLLFPTCSAYREVIGKAIEK